MKKMHWIILGISLYLGTMACGAFIGIIDHYSSDSLAESVKKQMKSIKTDYPGVIPTDSPTNKNPSRNQAGFPIATNPQ